MFWRWKVHMWKRLCIQCCRRSAVSRQACHLVGVLAEVLGHAFCGLALHFVDDLLKMVVITIQARRDCASRMVLAAA